MNTKSYNRETYMQPALIVSCEDPNGQQRCQIQTGPLSTITNIESLPWAKTFINHSQKSSQKGGPIRSTHSFKKGDWVMVSTPFAEGSHNYVIMGHSGTITDGSQGGGSALG